ncbi:MAG TPA: hypothetical protein VJP79_11355 [Nitrososphaera sp.]|nr:hypothetical protein [Nitrososphaera sp.]
MEKFKPLPFSLTGQAAQQENNVVTAAALVLDIAAIWVGGELYKCGNCSKSIIWNKRDQRPVVCKHCGKDINWVGIFTKYVVFCPQCKKEYVEGDKFCLYHSPAQALAQKEVEK